MRLVAALGFALALGGCVQSAPKAAVSAPKAAVVASFAAPPLSGPLRVTDNGAAFAYDQGAAARRVAQAQCVGQGRRLASSIYDRFEAGAWVYPGGCV